MKNVTMDERLPILLNAYLAGTLTENDRAVLLHLLAQEQQQEGLARLMQQAEEERILPEDLSGTEDRIVRGVMQRIHTGSVVPMRRTRAWIWAAAALLLVGTGAYVWHMYEKPRPAYLPEQAVRDVAPGSDKAYLTLSDGTVVTLDSAAGGALAQQGNTTVVKLPGGQVSYRPGGATQGGPGAAGAKGTAANAPVAMNTMRTPRGGQYRLILPDGTQVWLNAASSITYPVTFQSNERKASTHERKVTVSGEAFFEVAPGKDPFVVQVEGGPSIQVLGTQFDINSYSDEEAIKTTLLEGAVKVIAPGGPFLTLRPGQQAEARPGQQAQVRRGQQAQVQQKLTLVDHVDTDKIVAWKNGLFNFENVHLDEAMRQLSRWYDIDVVFERGVPDIQFEGEISRNVKLSDLLKVLSRAEVKFRIEANHKLVVLP